MTLRLKVLITDPDKFFVAGLKSLLNAHFHSKGIVLLFMDNPLLYPIADLIFWAPATPRIPNSLLTGRYLDTRFFVITSGEETLLTRHVFQHVFDRCWPCAVLLSFVDKAISQESRFDHAKLAAIYDPVTLLTPRQQEVMYYVSKGMRSHEIAKHMHVHEKTVSCHKRAAMGKLHLMRTAELHNWLINNHIPLPQRGHATTKK
ncbi:helix-turn-helix transcriptional regulator [Serratia rubidaea]|uniref:Helix-turn-helix transcriptional regulator n=1 Tax=Serratia rubidaea TaxID=61652 RepID=A0ABS0MFS1_SERRU|nr:helix-turn-helix transcriptional regulator [Serratia rubidaea]MBH1931199.1 helix-turn-helix transcriptional regulator [Serratia rubidaea]MDC6117161.1 helix-turn-helix transcriptional regulator [Serratia rubidaea]